MRCTERCYINQHRAGACRQLRQKGLREHVHEPWPLRGFSLTANTAGYRPERPQQNALSRRGLPLKALRMVNPEPRPHDLGQWRGFLVLSKPHGRPSRTDRINHPLYRGRCLGNANIKLE